MNGLILRLKKPKKNSKCLINLAHPFDYGFIIPRRFVYWSFVPIEIQSNILSYYKFDVNACLNFMKVSKSFKTHVEQLHIDIYEISLGICSKKYWLNKTLPPFIEMVYHFESFMPVARFNRKEILEVYCEGSLFPVFLHLFLCKRSCDGIEDYCWKCSRVRDRNFQALSVFDDVVLEQKDIYCQLGIDSEKIDFDVFLSYFGTSNSYPGRCESPQMIQYGGDVFILFVSVSLRVHLNVYYNCFLNFPLTLQDERYFIKKIQLFARDLCDIIWIANSNYCFKIFDKFKYINRSVCYNVDPEKPIKGPYCSKSKKRELKLLLLFLRILQIQIHKMFKTTMKKLESYMDKKHPNFRGKFYINRKNKLIHVGMDKSIFDQPQFRLYLWDCE